jgi:hypothetical protein
VALITGGNRGVLAAGKGGDLEVVVLQFERIADAVLTVIRFGGLSGEATLRRYATSCVNT